MFRITVVVVILLATIATSNAGGVEKQSFPPIPNAEAVIDACWKLSLKKRESGVTSEMRAGNLETALCLEEAILENAAILIDPLGIKKDQIKKKLKEIHSGYGGLYWHIFNSPIGCGFSCGTIHHVRHNWEQAKLYEKIFRDVIKQRGKYGT